MGAPRGGCFGRGVGGSVSNGEPEKGLVFGDGVNVDVGLHLEHIRDESAIGVMLKEPRRRAAIVVAVRRGAVAADIRLA